ncbi:efflux RND transporter periplasmic adaptor subunit [Ruegeria sp. 2012CJ41-6]|uniref:Efflux RND transporter periplasmic adaptor subunit n=1 Tax=Ruegeria spongiae TaxID=2942209 RepID=A0ABT0Q213_9RHOB|nr:efflux RND transporter periplasmic adaptor subunit [Ruegeria spongiae]MCL6283914.1 efflux RND transporter periplasmic adaptor subunit [Ruegeria spongiae]
MPPLSSCLSAPARSPLALRPFVTGIALAGALWTAPALAQEGESAPPKVSIAAAYTQEITDEAVFIGRGEAIDEVDIIARVSGFLEAQQVADGANVKKGELLFEIEPDLYEATLEARKADLDKAEANLELAKLELARKEELLRRDAVPVSERDVARANELEAEAQIKSAKAAIQQAELDLSYTKISAPFDGRLGRVATSVGDIVGPSKPPLVSLVREAPIYVSFAINEKLLLNVLQNSGETTATLASSDQKPDVFVELPNGTKLDETGHIVFVDNQIDPLTGAITIRAEFENTSRLLVDGAFVHVSIQALEPTLQVLIPQAALQRDQRGEFVLVVNNKQMVEQRYIQTGDPEGTAIIVTEGLVEGESVIVEGLQRVRPGVAVDAVVASDSPGE